MRYKIVISFFLVVFPHLTMAAETALSEPWNFTAKYTVAWSGITIGRIYITATEDATSYRMSVDTKTHGVGSLFGKERRWAEVTGKKSGTQFLPSRFESRPQSNDKGDRTELTYDDQGKLITRLRLPDDDPKWRPPVPREQANTATDPITAGFIVRDNIARAMASGEHSLHTFTYDGARLANMHVTLITPTSTLSIMDKTVEAVDITINRQPIIGYTPKELKKFKDGDPDIHLYFTADAKRIPVRITVDAPVGQLTATLVELK